MTLVFFAVGFFGLMGMTWLFPVLGCLLQSRCLQTSPRSSKPSASSADKVSKIVILIPAHNEELQLGATLDTINAAIATLKAVRPEISATVCVGADGCSDRTAEIATARGASVKASVRAQGKWRTLVGLIGENADADWTVLADSGILWPPDFMKKAIVHMEREGTAAVAPTYRNPNGGTIERAIWQVEAHFKSLEGKAGGPISIHGATVMYKTSELLNALGRLEGTVWLNDDIVLPLTVRNLDPRNRIHYDRELIIHDQNHFAPARRKLNVEFNRRRRMVLGNIQWMRSLFASARENNSAVYALAMRRVFRLLWAYWLAALAAAAVAVMASVAPLAAVLLALLPIALYPLSGSLRRLMDAAAASLLAPYYFIRNANFERTVWK